MVRAGRDKFTGLSLEVTEGIPVFGLLCLRRILFTILALGLGYEYGTVHS